MCSHDPGRRSFSRPPTAGARLQFPRTMPSCRRCALLFLGRTQRRKGWSKRRNSRARAISEARYSASDRRRRSEHTRRVHGTILALRWRCVPTAGGWLGSGVRADPRAHRGVVRLAGGGPLLLGSRQRGTEDRHRSARQQTGSRSTRRGSRGRREQPRAARSADGWGEERHSAIQARALEGPPGVSRPRLWRLDEQSSKNLATTRRNSAHDASLVSPERT
jgi:hypothetical protein